MFSVRDFPVRLEAAEKISTNCQKSFRTNYFLVRESDVVESAVNVLQDTTEASHNDINYGVPKGSNAPVPVHR